MHVCKQEMSQPEGSLRGAVFGGNPAVGPRLKRLRGSRNTAGTSTKSLAKEKERTPPAQDAGAILLAAGAGQMPPPPQRTPTVTQDTGTELGTPSVVVSDVRIPVNPQDLEKIPEAFRGTVYESANYAVSHIYKFTEKELRAIETMSPVDVMDSSMSMTLMGVVALHRSIIRARIQLDDMRTEHQATLQKVKATKDALTTSKVKLEKTRLKVQELETSLATSQADLEVAKTEVQAALEAERATSEQSLQDLFYHCWAFNPEADFSFMSPNLWANLVVKFQARLDKEAPPSETGETSGAVEQGETTTSKGSTDGA
ncbi:uncharacterized protein LOC133789997 [Humulus lupulus]|uniref:uncharacterized protein LOC133789997 n=1 Tax=Humulus lupulus TaxID=3486 RepID=UPI002B412672|nr:uncharacterized protein LOC133789997 [Humulus lupulus]